MPNLRELENAMPVAPLKIVALPSAAKMGREINDYMVEFRRSIHNDKVKKDPAFHGYIEDNYLINLDGNLRDLYSSMLCCTLCLRRLVITAH